jgi:multicomponent K+:H+ antiporter subunit E
MKRLLPYPLLWALLVAMWLVLNETIAIGQWLLAGVVALVAVLALRLLQAPQTRLRRPRAAVELVWLVLTDVVLSNIAVARIVLHRGTRKGSAGFVEIPLLLRNPVGLAALACIITSTPGTAWAGYDSRSGVLTMHILDLVDDGTWVRTIKERYEKRLLEIFQ